MSYVCNSVGPKRWLSGSATCGSPGGAMATMSETVATCGVKLTLLTSGSVSVFTCHRSTPQCEHVPLVGATDGTVVGAPLGPPVGPLVGAVVGGAEAIGVPVFVGDAGGPDAFELV